MELQASFVSTLNFDGVAGVAFAIRATGTLVTAGALSVHAVATPLCVAGLAGCASAVRATFAVVATIAF